MADRADAGAPAAAFPAQLRARAPRREAGQVAVQGDPRGVVVGVVAVRHRERQLARAATIEPRADGVAEAADRPAAGSVLEEGPLQVEFAAGETRIGLDPGAYGRAAILDAGVRQVDEVAVVHRVRRGLEAERAVMPVQADLGPVRGLAVQLRIAELVAARGHVQA